MPAFDFLDLDQFAKGTPYAALAELRRTEPSSWQPMPSPRDPHDGFWLVTRYADIVEISKKAELFHSNSGTLLDDHPPAPAPAPWSMVKNEFCSLDGEMHRAYRQAIAPEFAPKAIAGMRAALDKLARDVVGELCHRGSVDFAEAVAVRFPVDVVLGQLLGLPPGDRERAAYWSDVISAPEDPEFRHRPDSAIRAIAEMYDYALRLYADRCASPRADLASVIAHARLPDGTAVGLEVFSHYFWSMILGSFDTTASTIATGTEAFLDFPDEWDRLTARPELLPSAVEECLRWASAAVYFRRTVTRDTDLRGHAMKAGQRIALCYPAGNCDDEVFAEPDRFDVGRTPNNHLSFGYGAHFCLGAHLVRMELSAIFGELLRRGVRLRKTGPVVRTRSNFLNRVKRFPVEVFSATS